jgi:methionyl-tRNA formyltransferase
MGLTLFLMTQKGLAVLEALTAHFPALVECVVGSRDASIEKDYYEEIKGLCAQANVPFRDRKEAVEIRTRYAIAISWRWIIKAGAAELIVLHDSLLPRYRGFNPLVSALINGDDRIGVTALFATEEYDRGLVIGQASTPVTYPLRIQRAIDLVALNYADLVLQVAKTIAAGGELEARPQDESQATYSLWRDEEDYFIDWASSAERIKRLVDAVGYPYKGAATRLDGRVIRVRDCEVVEDVRIENRAPGKVIFVANSLPVVVCGSGLLRIAGLADDETNAALLPLPRFRCRFG